MKIARGPGLELYRAANGRWQTLPPNNMPAIQSSDGECICRMIEDARLIGYRCPCHPTREGKDEMLNTLTNVERAICAAQGLTEAQFLVQKARNAVAPMSVSVHRETIVQDAMRDATAADCAREAIKELEAFIRDPEHLDGLQFIINASGLIESALKKAGARRQTAGGY